MKKPTPLKARKGLSGHTAGEGHSQDPHEVLPATPHPPQYFSGSLYSCGTSLQGKEGVVQKDCLLGGLLLSGRGIDRDSGHI